MTPITDRVLGFKGLYREAGAYYGICVHCLGEKSLGRGKREMRAVALAHVKVCPAAAASRAATVARFKTSGVVLS